MATIIYLRTGHAYRVADTVTLAGVNTKLNETADRFVEVPLHPDSASVVAGTPGEGMQVKGLFITPDSVSHFVVV